MARATQPDPKVMTSSADVSDSVVSKMGKALAEIAEVEQELADAVGTIGSETDRMQLAARADQAIADAVADQGLSITQFNQVVQAADTDPDLRNRLTQAIRAA